jgi:hypothetical protein
VYSSYPLEGGSWSSELNIRGGYAISDGFDLAVTNTGRPAVLFFETGLHYLEFDGSAWNPEITIDSGACSFPQLRFENGDPAAVYLLEKATGQIQPMYSTRRTGVFSTPAVIDDRMSTFDKVILYNAGASSYQDVTTAASDATPGDLSHPTSTCALKDVGDKMYLGMNQAFRYMRVLLSTTGVGGAVAYSYFDGVNWVAFAPASGGYNFDSADHELLLWTDYNTIPEVWQKTPVNGSSNFWVKVEVTTGFSTGPVGTQMTAISDLRAICLRR